MVRSIALISSLFLMLAACGETPGTRAVTGGAIGAGTGAVVGSATGAGALPGAVVGGAGGAAVGAATTPRRYYY
jgi:osmotically inducible lipoprotein OsmB